MGRTDSVVACGCSESPQLFLRFFYLAFVLPSPFFLPAPGIKTGWEEERENTKGSLEGVRTHTHARSARGFIASLADLYARIYSVAISARLPSKGKTRYGEQEGKMGRKKGAEGKIHGSGKADPAALASRLTCALSPPPPPLAVKADSTYAPLYIQAQKQRPPPPLYPDIAYRKASFLCHV